MDTPGACPFSISPGLQFMLEKQIFPLNIFFKGSSNISLLDNLEAVCARMAHAYRYLADFASTLKNVKGYALGSINEDIQSWCPQLERKLEFLSHCQAAVPHPVKASGGE